MKTLLISFLLLVCSGALLSRPAPEDVDAGTALVVKAESDPPRYIGSKKCANCHKGAAKGDQYHKWEQGPHARAYAVLATEKARAVAAERGIEDPQKSGDCLKCHSTGYGSPPEHFQRGFKTEEGVGCEACHGPGEDHFKAQLKNAAKGGTELGAVAEGEIVSRPPLDTCLHCHSKESPTFKPFCYRKRWAEIAHLDPRKGRSKEELEAMKCHCGESCACVKGECGTPWSKKD